MMGQGMAHNLLAKGFKVSVMGHRNRKPVEELVAEGAREAASVQDLVDGADAVILCVTSSVQVEDLVFRAGGILESARSGQVVIDCSTSEPSSSVKIAERLAAKGIKFVDAPLARTPVEAMQGRLNTMVGADDATFAQVRPVLEAFCENIFHIGGTTSAQKLKLLNNFLAIGAATLAAEALAMCEAVGVDQRKFFEVVSKGGANSGIFQMLAGGILEGRADGMKFSIDNARKDLGYYNNLTAAAANSAMLGTAMEAALRKSSAEGLGGEMLGAMVGAHKARSAAGK
jgi:3-hydroxyisobutyrate dehydrogenase-like beta-hydroxyacid dehydrogenase